MGVISLFIGSYWLVEIYCAKNAKNKNETATKKNSEDPNLIIVFALMLLCIHRRYNATRITRTQIK